MLTGPQIRDARTLAGWSPGELGLRARVALGVIEQAEERDDTALLTYGQEIAIRRVCGAAGIVFIDHPPSARSRIVGPDSPI